MEKSEKTVIVAVGGKQSQLHQLVSVMTGVKPPQAAIVSSPSSSYDARWTSRGSVPSTSPSSANLKISFIACKLSSSSIHDAKVSIKERRKVVEGGGRLKRFQEVQGVKTLTKRSKTTADGRRDLLSP